MFTGIVEALVPLLEVQESGGIRCLSVAAPAPLLASVKRGDSVAVNGVCLTRTDASAHRLQFEVVRETLERSNLAEMQAGDKVHLESSLKFGDAIGGHLVAGHVWNAIPCIAIEQDADNRFVWFALDDEYSRYILHKGFVALDGVSLTVARVEPYAAVPRFGVTLIPETLARTRFAWLQPGMKVNLEVDSQTQAIVETVERVLNERSGAPGTPE